MLIRTRKGGTGRIVSVIRYRPGATLILLNIPPQAWGASSASRKAIADNSNRLYNSLLLHDLAIHPFSLLRVILAIFLNKAWERFLSLWREGFAVGVSAVTGDIDIRSATLELFVKFAVGGRTGADGAANLVESTF